MFTGLIEEIGSITAVASSATSLKLSFHCPAVRKGLATGDSVAVDGVCLTVEELLPAGFSCYASPETVRLTALRDRSVGDGVNLERALALGARLGGHLVSGHVDGTGRFLSAKASDGAWEVRISAPPHIIRQSIHKGSLAIDGISLTIAELRAEEMAFWVIPETWQRTTLSRRKPGATVNLEADMIGKYVFRFLEQQGIPPGGAADGRLMDLLQGGSWGSR